MIRIGFKYYCLFFVILIILVQNLNAGRTITPDKIPADTDLLYALRDSIPELNHVYSLRDSGRYNEALEALTNHFKNAFRARYYFDWQQLSDRLKYYTNQYPDAMANHKALSRYQKTTFSAKTSWILPFRNLRNEDVTAYELRHLARQQKSLDMALMYFAGEEKENLAYFYSQVADLNDAFAANTYDDAGNAIYEVFRAGKRVNNWLFCHNVYLNEPEYSIDKQLLLIRTFMHHGAQLAERGAKVRYGNHHTRGMVALFEIAALFPEFEVCGVWRNLAIHGLLWHIENEINTDGFQFERSVHYHKGDIENYFRVYQLARINGIELPEIYTSQFRKLFESLVLLAQPNLKLPVLQDDTDAPFTEYNEMADVLTLGTIIFRDPAFRYFASDTIPSAVFWLIDDDQLSTLGRIEAKKPEILSTELAQTGYYIMRNGWQQASAYATITAGLSEHKPDHQHGDMLGLVAFANGHEILPNYQVRYKDDDYRFWKNSWVKNVALLDSIPLGRGWQPNTGGSGFGKWKFLPQPQVISWIKTDQYDHFNGTHDGYDSLGVRYYREVVFIKDGFWLVIDRFRGNSQHTAHQVWQGDFNVIAPGHIEKAYPDGSGLEIIQFNDLEYHVEKGNFRNKNNAVFSVKFNKSLDLYTLIRPFLQRDSGYEQKINQWQINPDSVKGIFSDSPLILDNSNKNLLWLFDCMDLNWRTENLRFARPVTLFIEEREEQLEITVFSREKVQVSGTPNVKNSPAEVLTGNKIYMIK